MEQPYGVVSEAPGALYPTLHAPDQRVGLHRHQTPYVALILDGSYEEWSADGRYLLERGDVVLHGRYHAHGNCIRESSRVLNLVLNVEPPCSAKRVVRLQGLAGWLADIRCDPVGAASRLLSAVMDEKPRAPLPPPTSLAAAAEQLRRGPELPITDLARRESGVSPEHFARSFRRHFGMSPTAYRAEHRFRRALARLDDSPALAGLAAESGYADQSHMTRDFRARTGHPPARLARLRATPAG
ncbi:hypothetical protein ABI59_05440 [Acidobacteria bacterium Mor1]|nr:hypothetical protein ABI59_05440 [Acidobacteria bacterium Mor1]